MALAKLEMDHASGSVQHALDRPVADQTIERRMAALEGEFRLLRETLGQTKQLIDDREKKARTLLDAYKQVIGDFTDLFDAQRKESIRREESARFFLSSIEGRINNEIQKSLSGKDGLQSRKRFGLFRK